MHSGDARTRKTRFLPSRFKLQNETGFEGNWCKLSGNVFYLRFYQSLQFGKMTCKFEKKNPDVTRYPTVHDWRCFFAIHACRIISSYAQEKLTLLFHNLIHGSGLLQFRYSVLSQMKKACVGEHQSLHIPYGMSWCLMIYRPGVGLWDGRETHLPWPQMAWKEASDCAWIVCGWNISSWPYILRSSIIVLVSLSF